MTDDYFSHLNVQTNSNLSFSLIKIEELIDWAKKNQLGHLAISDYYPYEFLKFYNLCKENKIKPIIGVKVIIQEEQKQYLLTIFPQNGTGYKDLIQKVFNPNAPSSRIFPLTEIMPLQKNCLLVFAAHNLEDIIYFSQQTFFQSAEEGKSSFYIGFDFCLKEPKKDLPSPIIPFLLPFFAVKTLAGEDIALYESLPKTSLSQFFLPFDTQQKFIPYLNEEEFFPFCAKSKIFYKILLSQVKDFLAKINLKIIFSGSKVNENKKDFVELQAHCEKKLFFLQKESQKEYEERLEEELEVINKLGYTRYFLILHDIVNDLREKDIIVGPGRGSAVSSLVAYLLGITKIDPLEYNLFFARFLNKKRKSPPDIDIDVENQRQVINCLQIKYGKEQIARVATRQKLGWKKALQESAKTINHERIKPVISEDQLKDIISCVKDDNLLESLKSKALQNKFPDLFARAAKLKDFYFNHSLHASGVIISEKKPLTQLLPCQQEKDCLISYYAEKDLNLLGLKKYDFLNLTSLGTLREVENILPKKQLPKCNLQDKVTWKLLNCGWVSGIPQLDTASFRELISRFQPRVFSDLALILALNRPGARQNSELICQKKNQGNKKFSSSVLLHQILAETYGSIVFEEQISQILVFIFDYSFADAEIQRRDLKKMNGEELTKFKHSFLVQAKKKIPSNESERLLEQMVNNAYAFNKSHAVAYSYLSYYFAFLKANYFSSLITYFLNNQLNSPEKTSLYLQEAFFYEFTIQKPEINFSEIEWSRKEKNLWMGFAYLKNFNQDFFQAIINERNQKGKFLNWDDFFTRTSSHWEKIELSVFQGWVEVGLFSSLKIDANYLFVQSEVIFRYLRLKQNFPDSSQFLPTLDWPSGKLDEKKIVTSQKEINTKEWENWGIYVSYFSAWREAKKTWPLLQTSAAISANLSKWNNQEINLIIYAVIQSIQARTNYLWLTLYDSGSSLKIIISNEFYQKNKEFLTIQQSAVFHLLVKISNYKLQSLKLQRVEV